MSVSAHRSENHSVSSDIPLSHRKLSEGRWDKFGSPLSFVKEFLRVQDIRRMQWSGRDKDLLLLRGEAQKAIEDLVDLGDYPEAVCDPIHSLPGRERINLSFDKTDAHRLLSTIRYNRGNCRTWICTAKMQKHVRFKLYDLSNSVNTKDGLGKSGNDNFVDAIPYLATEFLERALEYTDCDESRISSEKVEKIRMEYERRAQEEA